MGTLIHRIVAATYIVLDIVITLFSFSLYNDEKFLDFHNILKTLNIKEYNFFTSPLDFAVLSALRIIILISSIVMIRFGKKDLLDSLYGVVLSIGVLMYAVSLGKVLAFDENPEFLKYPGVYVNISSSIISTIVLCIIINKSLISGQFDYQTLVNEELEANSTDAETGNNSSAGDSEDKKAESEEKDEEEEQRLPFKTHVAHIGRMCYPQWKWFLISYVFLIIYCALSLIEPALYSKMMTNVITSKSMEVLWQSCFYLIVVECLCTITRMLKFATMGNAKKITSRQVRVDLFKAILNQDISFFDKNKTGELLSRITHDSESISESLPKYIETATTNIISLCGSLPILFYYSWQMSIIAFITVPICALLSKVYGSYVEKLSQKENDATAKSNDTVQEVFSAVRTVRSFAAEHMEFEKYRGKSDDCYKIGKKTVIVTAIYNFAWGMMWNIEDVSMYLYGGYLTLNGRMAPETVLTYAFYHYKLINALNSFSDIFSDLMRTIGLSRKVIYLLNRKPEFDYSSGTERPNITGSIIFDGVEFAYPTRKSTDVLKGLSLSFEPGKTTALVGPSGNGKTTIVSLIQQFYQARNGAITIDGTQIQDIEHHYYHRKIALVAQEPTLFSGTIRENILYGFNEGTEEDMIRVAKMANVHEFVEKLEKGYDTACGEKGVQMSGGQKQRIAIARALIRDPAVLILDEATSALDTESEAKVQDAINRCAKDRTVIVIAHRLSTVRNADRIAVIEKGLVAEIGTHEELMEQTEGLYYKLVSRQLEKQKVENEIF